MTNELDKSRVAGASAMLRAAADGNMLDSLADFTPGSIEEAYAIQAATRSFATATAWKIAVLPSLDGAVTAAISNAPVSPAKLASAGRRMFGVEAEFAFRFGEELPSNRPLNSDEVLAAVASVHPVIEVVESRFKDLSKVDMLSVLADSLSSESLIVGAGSEDWRTVNLLGKPVRIYIDDDLTSEALLINPRDLADVVVQFAQHNAQRGIAIKAGDIVTTGVRAPFVTAHAGAVVRAIFEGLGEVQAAFN